MSKKLLIIGLFMTLLASSALGASDALADTIYPYGGLTCSPMTQQGVGSGDLVSFSAYYSSYSGTPVTGQMTWTAVGGSPSSGTGSFFSTRFYTSGTQFVTVTDGYQTSTCTVYMSSGYSPTPYPYQSLQCSPTYTTIDSGDRVRLSASGGNGDYFWSAPDGSPSSGNDTSFSVRFTNPNVYGQYRTATVTSAGQSAVCTVFVNGNSASPTPFAGSVSIDHTIRNITRGTESSSVTAYNGDRLQFIVRITTGSQNAEDVNIRDWLPLHVNYVRGTTTVDSSRKSDGITTGSISLGRLTRNRTTVVRFEGTLNGAPATTLTNSVNVHVSGLADQTRTSNISVTGSYYTPTPTPYYTYTPNPTARTVLTTRGRNITRGQTGENTSVRASGGDTVDLILRVRSINGSYLYNTVVTDVLPTGLSFIPGSTTLNGTPVADGITSSGINIGTVSPNTDSVVKLSVRIDGSTIPTVGVISVKNTAYVRADSLATLSVQLPVTLGQIQNLAALGAIQTGLSDSLWLALIVALLATGSYAAYTHTNAFRRRIALAEVNRLSRTSGMNFTQ